MHIAEERLQEYLLGRLPETDAEAVEAHLLGCDACQDRMRGTAAYGALRRAFSEAGPPEPDAA